MISDLLRSTGNKSRIVLPIVVIPDNTEDIRALSNTIEVCKELNSINIPYMLIDNGKAEGSLAQRYNAINNSIVEDIQVIRGDFNSKTSLDNMDFNDSYKLFSCAGLLTINKISGFKSTSLDKSSFDDLIIKSIKESYNVQLQKDKQIKKMGIILTVTKEMLELFDRNIPNVKKEIGIPKELFLHINICENDNDCSIITILSGLSMPDDRLEEMIEIIESAKSNLTSTTTSNINDLASSIDWLSSDDDEDDDDEELQNNFNDTLDRW